jgi:glycerophosphoryl diester phosphodiesterase
MQRMVYGHRGAPAELPENTVPSFVRAVEAGANALEMDAHLTADGHVVIVHDPTGLRMAAVREKVGQRTLQQVRQWDVGWGWVGPGGTRPFAGKGFRVPTLQEVVEATRVLLNIDAKSAEVVVPLVKEVQRLGAAQRVRLASFSQTLLNRMRRAGWKGMLGLGPRGVAALRFCPELLLRPRTRLRWRPLDADALQIPIHYGRIRFDSPRFLSRAHRLGMRVDFWTIDDPDEARRLLALGADGVVTNDPARMSGVLL